MEKYKNNEEAAKSYADLLQLDMNTEQGKLQYESACLDFAAGANWKDEQLRLSNVSQRSELFFAFLKWAKQADLDYPDKMLLKDFEQFNAKNCG